LKLLALYFLLAGTCAYNAQSFSGTGGAIINNTTYNFTIGVNGLPAQIDSTFGLQNVGIDITHPAVEQLHIYLRSPSGIQVELTGTKSCKGDGFVNTTFMSGAPLSIASATAPFTGTFSPVGNLGRVNNEMPGNGTWRLFIHHLSPSSFTGTVNGWTLTFGPSPAKAVILSSSNLPIVFINTPGGAPLTESDTLVSLGIIDNGSSRNYITDNRNSFNGKASCHIRGSSSRMFEKKNLKIELKNMSGGLDTMAALAGMPVESDWMLTACYTDKTLIRNALSQDLFRQMGHYTPRYRFVEVVLNDEYFGVYMLMEQVKRGNSRVNIKKMEPISSQFPEITGGYIVQIDRTDNPGWYSSLPGVSANGAKFFYQYNYPKYDVITLPQQNYLKAVLDTLENTLAASYFNDVEAGYRRYIDIESFIDYLILQEVAKNVDAFKLSMYLYKDNHIDGGKWHAGPVWDFDLAWHNANYGNAFNPDIWQHVHNNSSNPIPKWWGRLLEDSLFSNRLQCRYRRLRETYFSNDEMFKYIDSQTELLKEARERNFRQFPIIGAYIWPNPQQQAGATYQTEIEDLKTWVVNRCAWLDGNVPGQCLSVGLTSYQNDNHINVYPNPFTESFTVNAEKVDRIRLLDMTGSCVKEIKPTDSLQTMNVNVAQLPEGLYFVELTNGKTIIFKKLLKLNMH
jgi:subtilisin-like proprotein convertase family protein